MNRPIVHFDEGWKIMQNGINKLTGFLQDEISEPTFSAEEYMSQYTAVYNMCTQRAPHEYSEKLYERYKGAFTDYLGDRVLPKVQKQESGPHLLRSLKVAWENQEVMVRWLSRFFNYLDRYYVGRHNLPTLDAVALHAFRDHVYRQTHERAKDALLELIRQEREGDQVDREPIKKVIEVFQHVSTTNLDKYREDFEEPLLASVKTHYAAKAAEWIQSDSCAEYLKKAEKCIKDEAERADAYLHGDSKKPVIQATQEELLEKVQATLITKDSGAHAMLRDNKTDDLERLFKLYNACGNKSIEPIADIFRKHIEDEGMSLVKQVTDKVAADNNNRKEVQEAEKKFVEEIIKLQDKYVSVVKQCFAAHSSMHKALKDAHESFCNKAVAQTSTAELLANYCDHLLKKGEKQPEEWIDSQLEKVVKLLVFINDRDIFGEWHRKRLAKRLLAVGSVDNLEQNFLQRLKGQCGAQFTQKMEGMCNDLQTARQKQQEYAGWREGKEKLEVDLEVKVLTTGFWPTYTAAELSLPAEMAACVSSFQTFYSETTKNRKLLWVHNLGHVNVAATFKGKKKEFVLHPFQAALLMLFNDADDISVADMLERLNLGEEDVVRTVSSLAHAKHQILKKRKPPGAAAEAEGGEKEKDKKKKNSRPTKADVYHVNTAFSNQLVRIKVPMPVAEDKRKVVEEVQKDRKYAIDAAVVRIMKSRKTLEHQQLVPQVLQQVSRTFTADAKMVKKRLEDLIDREYLTRDENNANMYRYVA